MTNKKAPVHAHTGLGGLVVKDALTSGGSAHRATESASTCQTTVVVEHIGIDGIAQGGADSATGCSANHGTEDRPSDGADACAPRTGHEAQGCPKFRAELGRPGNACGSRSRTGQRANGTADFAGAVARLYARGSALGTVRNA